MKEQGEDGLTPEAFEALLALLDPDRDRAGERYLSFHAKLVWFFEVRGCRHPEVLADKTINRVARRVSNGLRIESPDPLAFFWGVAHNVYKEVLRQVRREAPGSDDEPAPPAPEEPPEDARLECVLRCLKRLRPEDRELILRYHEDEDRIRGRRRLAEELGIRLNALRIRAHRLRRELKSCVERCLAESP